MKEKFYARMIEKLLDSKSFNVILSPFEKIYNKADDFKTNNKDVAEVAKILFEKLYWYAIIIAIVLACYLGFLTNLHNMEYTKNLESIVILPSLEKELGMDRNQIYLSLEEQPINNFLLNIFNITDSSHYIYEVTTATNGNYMLELHVNEAGQLDHSQLIPISE